MMRIRKSYKRIATTVLAAGLCMGISLHAEAAPRQMSDGGIFDAEYYAENNPDVAAVLGYDATALYQHYISSGQAEGRLPYAPDTDVAALKIIMEYGWNPFQARIDALSDWKMGWVADESDSTEWHHIIRYSYQQVEYVEGMCFDAAAYAAANPDVAAIYGTEPTALWEQYKTVGVYEGRPVQATTEEARARLVAIDAMQGAINGTMSDREKILAAHDWITYNTSYDMVGYRTGWYEGNDFNMYGVFLEHVAVCQGYAQAFDYLMYLLDIPCEVVRGYARGSHAWNRVWLDGGWLYVDTTWDDPIGGRPTHTYFLVTEEQIGRNHVMWETYDLYSR